MLYRLQVTYSILECIYIYIGKLNVGIAKYKDEYLSPLIVEFKQNILRFNYVCIWKHLKI